MAAQDQILVVIDPTADEQPALERAAWLPAGRGAPLELFVCDYDQAVASRPLFDVEGLERVRESVLARHTERLEALRAPLVARGLDVTIDAQWGRPLHRGIVDKVESTRPSLVVKDTHEHPMLRRTLLSNTDWHLIRECPVPLLLVKPRAIGSPPKVLAAVDPFHEHDEAAQLDRRIMAFAADIAGAVGGQFHVLHAFDTAPFYAATADSPLAMTTLPPPEMLQDLAARHRAALQHVVADYPVDREHVHFDEGAPHRRIAELAEELGADFVVMGAVSRSGLERIFVGSTAERALDRLPCDLVVVKPPGFAAPAET